MNSCNPIATTGGAEVMHFLYTTIAHVLLGSSRYHHPQVPTYLSNLQLQRRPDVKFFCNVHYDPFKFMEQNNKVYGEVHFSTVCPNS